MTGDRTRELRAGGGRPAPPRARAASGLFAAGLLLAAHAPSRAPAAPPPGEAGAPTLFECRWARSPIRIDGRADERAWRDAAPIRRFGLPWLGAGARPAATATTARLLWDRDALYFAADMEDRDLVAAVTEHDGRTWHDDVFELFFKPAADRPAYYEFQVNAAGTVLDMLIPERRPDAYDRFRSDGEFHVEAAVALRGTLNRRDDRDAGWSVEGRIPWSDFARTGGAPQPGDVWRFALCRYDYAAEFPEPELSTCAPLTRRSFHQWEDYASLRFVAPEPGRERRGAPRSRRAGQ